MAMTKEERALAATVEKGEWKISRNAHELKTFSDAARHMLKKDARLNIRISSHDLKNLQKKASEDGLPYQTYVSSLLHKFVSGRLVEVK